MSSKPTADRASQVTYQFANIGPVRDAALELGRLTLIAGLNNTGKTYISYSLYGFLKTWRAWPRTWDFLREAQGGYPRAAEVVQSLRYDGRAKVPLPVSSIAHQRRQLAEALGRDFSTGILPQVFSTRRESFQESTLAVQINGRDTETIPTPAEMEIGQTKISMRHDGTNLVASIDGSERSSSLENIEMETSRAYCLFLLRDLFPDPFILSAERFGISLFYRELDFTKNQLVDLLQKLRDEGSRRSVSPFLVIDRSTSRYALPIKDNIDFTRSIPDLPKGVSALADHKLFDDVKNMIDGYYGNATDEIRFISKARGKGRSFNIPLHLASSSARGLSDLYLGPFVGDLRHCDIRVAQLVGTRFPFSWLRGS